MSLNQACLPICVCCFIVLQDEILVLLSAENNRLQFVLGTRGLLYWQTCLEEKGKGFVTCSVFFCVQFYLASHLVEHERIERLYVM